MIQYPFPGKDNLKHISLYKEPLGVLLGTSNTQASRKTLSLKELKPYTLAGLIRIIQMRRYCTVERDLKNITSLSDAGWRVITVWECELKPEKRESTLQSLCAEICNLIEEDVEKEDENCY